MDATEFNRLERRDGVYILRRTATPYTTVAAIVTEAAHWKHRLPEAARLESVLVRDLRDVRGNNDPKIDAARNEHNGPLFRGWGLVVGLLQTEVGRLHCMRAFRAMGVATCACFTSEEEALREAVRRVPDLRSPRG